MSDTSIATARAPAALMNQARYRTPQRRAHRSRHSSARQCGWSFACPFQMTVEREVDNRVDDQDEDERISHVPSSEKIERGK